MKHTLLRLGWITWLGLFLTCGAFGQISGSITSTQCVSVDVSQTGSTVGIQVTGTWSGTLQPQITIQGNAPVNTVVTPVGSTTSQSTITANGGFTAAVAGASTFQVCGNTVGSGTATVFLNRSQAAVKSGGGGAATPAGIQSALQPGIYATTYGVVGEGHLSFKGNFTNTSPIITCSDCHFLTNATVGQVVFGSTLTTIGFSSTTTLLLGANGTDTTIASIDSDTQIHASTNALGTCAGTCFITWGTYEDTQLTNAWNAAYGACTMLTLPALNPEGTGPAVIFVKSAQFIGNGTCLGAGGTGFYGVGVQGSGGSGQTFVMVTPNMSAATCTTACFFGGVSDGMNLQHFTIHGGGNSVPGSGFNGKIGVQIAAANESKLYDVLFMMWGGNQFASASSFFTGLDFHGGQIRLMQAGEDGFGSVGITTTSSGNLGPMLFWGLGAYDNNLVNMLVESGANVPVSSYGGSYGGVNSGNSGILGGVDIAVVNGTTFYSEGDTIGINNQLAFENIISGIVLAQAGSASTTYIEGDIIQNAMGGTGIFMIGQNGATNPIFVRNSKITSPGTSGQIMSPNGTIFDMGGNTFSTGAGGLIYKATSTGSYRSDGRSVNGTCTGVGTAASTLGLFGTGPNETLTTCTSTTIGSGIVMQAAGNLQILTANASAGGVNASSGVVTVLKNGGATALTCTLGTATFCADGAHTVSYVAGDLISLQFTTQAADTLAGVKASVSEF